MGSTVEAFDPLEVEDKVLADLPGQSHARPGGDMYVKYLETLSSCLLGVLRQLTHIGQARVKVQKGEPPSGGLPVAQVIEYQGRESPLRGFFVLGFPTQEMALTLANALGAKMGLAASQTMDQTALDLLGEFMNTVVGRTISAWDRLGMPVTFGPPSPLQQAQIQPVEGFDNQSYLITLSMDNSYLVFSTTFSQVQNQPEDNRRVLVVDDSRTLRHVLETTLVGAGYDVAQANNGIEAVQQYQTFRPAVVLMDLVMPKLGGLDAIMAIRENDPQARFVVLTSSDRRDEVVTAKTLGVLDYIIKPVDSARLLKVVGAACRLPGAGTQPRNGKSRH